MRGDCIAFGYADVYAYSVANRSADGRADSSTDSCAHRHTYYCRTYRFAHRGPDNDV